MKAIMKPMSAEPLRCSVSFIKMSPVPVPKKMKTGNNQFLPRMSFRAEDCAMWESMRDDEPFFPPTTNTKATKASTMPIVATKFSFSFNRITPAKVGKTTESLLDSEVTVTPERCVEAAISK